MVNLIYIHGLYSSPRMDKLAVLERFSDRLYAPYLNYEKDDSIFTNLLSACNSQEINYVVGSSAGGLMGYWLAKHIGCPALLFNPALNSKHHRLDIFPPEEKPSSKNYFLNIILGVKDEQIIPQETQEYLEANEDTKSYVLDWQAELAHSIDLDTFQIACEKYLPDPANL
jgi:hypothetical protein